MRNIMIELSNYRDSNATGLHEYTEGAGKVWSNKGKYSR